MKANVLTQSPIGFPFAAGRVCVEPRAISASTFQPAKLAAMAHEEFTEIQGEMQGIAARIAKERHLPSSDYRDVIRELKKQQLIGDAILPFYENRLKQIEKIIVDAEDRDASRSSGPHSHRHSRGDRPAARAAHGRSSLSSQHRPEGRICPPA